MTLTSSARMNVRGVGTGPGFPGMVERAIRRRRELAAESMAPGPNTSCHLGALAQLADLVGTLSNAHPAMFALWFCRVSSEEASFAIRPGSEFSRVLSRVGADGSAPPVSAVLHELVAGGG